MSSLGDFESKIGITFDDKALLKRAFTHRSYINENKESDLRHNERLEFLGDAVLELVVTHFLFEEYPDKTEGQMTAFRAALVNTTMLSEVGQELDINDLLLLSKGESKDTGRARQYILANTMEAIIGAIYLDKGYEVARDFILKYITPRIEKVLEERTWIDAKSLFQEKAQENEGVTPSYKTLKEEGPDHDKHFTVGVFLGHRQVGEGRGNSKQEAEQDAARNALEVFGW